MKDKFVDAFIENIDIDYLLKSHVISKVDPNIVANYLSSCLKTFIDIHNEYSYPEYEKKMNIYEKSTEF